jgi:hypothetical protein
MAKFESLFPVDVQVIDILNNTGKQLNFWGLTPDEIKDILNRLTTGGPFGKPKPDKHIRKAWSKGKALTITIDNTELDAFIDSGLKSIQSSLIHTRPGDADGILALTDVVAHKCSTISKAEMDKLFKDSDDSEVVMWQNYLNNIEDPKTREMLILYSKIYGNTVYGHPLSLKNAMTIRRIDPNATFVLARTSWEKFGRAVKRGAKRYPLWGWRPDKTKVTKADIDNAQRALGHDGAKFEDLSLTVQDAILKKASAGKGSMIRYIGYDISDTYQFTKDNLLQTKPGIIGNVAYTLNKLAQDLEAEKQDHKNIEGYDEMMVKTQKAVKSVEGMCAEKGITPQITSQHPSTQLADLLLAYYHPIVGQKSNILKPENITQFTEDAVQLTLLINNIGLDQLKRFKHSYEYTQKEVAALAPIILKTSQQLGRDINGLNENNLNDKASLIARFKDALRTLGIKVVKDEEPAEIPSAENTTNMNVQTPNEMDVIKENFYKIYNKLTEY